MNHVGLSSSTELSGKKMGKHAHLQLTNMPELHEKENWEKIKKKRKGKLQIGH